MGACCSSNQEVVRPPRYVASQYAPPEKVRVISNVTPEEVAAHPMHVIFCLDISGSMFDNTDSHMHLNGKVVGHETRYASMISDLLRFMNQLKTNMQVVLVKVITFDTVVNAFDVATPYDENSIAHIIQYIHNRPPGQSGGTRTDLAIALANDIMHRQWDIEAKIHDDTMFGSEFIKTPVARVVLTDGVPFLRGEDYEVTCRRVEDHLVASTERMTRDIDCVTIFIQYGTDEYAKESPTSQFLQRIDSGLVELLRAKAARENQHVEEKKKLFDAVDCAQREATWGAKDTQNVMSRGMTQYDAQQFRASWYMDNFAKIVAGGFSG